MNPNTLSRLASQLECLPDLLGSATPEELHRRPASGKWSAHENLAHLLRHHEVMVARMRRILSEDAPRLERYDAEGDLDWPRCAALATDEVLGQLRGYRKQLLTMAQEIGPEKMDRIGVHVRFGAMPLSLWVEFFLIHEAHHLYTAFLRVRGA